MFNFNGFVYSIINDKILENPGKLPCNCKGSQYIDKYHGHVVTGDLRIISGNSYVKCFVKVENLWKVSALTLKWLNQLLLKALMIILNWVH